jgi:hypothetical protein
MIKMAIVNTWLIWKWLNEFNLSQEDFLHTLRNDLFAEYDAFRVAEGREKAELQKHKKQRICMYVTQLVLTQPIFCINCLFHNKYIYFCYIYLL